uniref:C-type lectin domain-containing protein n=1 Tax=Fundulus heteroclitus TaxID=8078 RepID=A0A3Q2QSC9_FUNHE
VKLSITCTLKLSCGYNQLYHYIDVKKTWTEAQQYCRENHTDLATVSDMEGLKRLLRKSPERTDAWIGLYDQTNGIKRWYWSLPGVEFNENKTEWKSGEPNDCNTENCGCILKSLKWNDISCGERGHFLCYDEKLILIKENKTWKEALYYCRDHHHDLVTITNLDEQRWVQEKAKKASTDYVWTGLRYACSLDFWFWVRGEVVSYKNWAADGLMDDCDIFKTTPLGTFEFLKKKY